MSRPPVSPAAGVSIILYDGVCNLCNRSVVFILKRDPAARFRFATLQSETGQQLLRELGLPSDYRDSFLLLEPAGANWRPRQKTSAALQVARQLRQPWPCCVLFLLVPAVLRDPVYDWVGRNRYRWFGRRALCAAPEPAWAERFLP